VAHGAVAVDVWDVPVRTQPVAALQANAFGNDQVSGEQFFVLSTLLQQGLALVIGKECCIVLGFQVRRVLDGRRIVRLLAM